MGQHRTHRLTPKAYCAPEAIPCGVWRPKGTECPDLELNQRVLVVICVLVVTSAVVSQPCTLLRPSAAKEGRVSAIHEQLAFDGHTIDTKAIRVRLKADLTFEVTDKRTGHTWLSGGGGQQWRVTKIDTGKSRVRLSAEAVDDGTEYEITVEASGPEISFTLSGHPDATVEKHLVFPPGLQSRAGDYVVVPYAQGLILPVDELDLGRDLWYHGYKTSMAWCGITNLTDGYMVLLTTPADGGLLVQPRGPQGSQLLGVQAAWVGEKGKFGTPRTTVYVFVDKGGYNVMARRYRQWAEKVGYIKPFREKLQDRPHLDRLIGAVDFWGRKGTNDLEFYRQLRSLGIDRAICSLGGGWIAPKGVSDLVRELNEMGYLPSHYDIYTDVWPGSETDEPRWARKHGYPEDVYVNRDGSLRKGWVIRTKDAQYQGYYICSSQHAKEAIPRISADLAENPYLCRFIDVVTAIGPTECYSEVHPLTRTQDIEAKREMLDLVSGRFALVTGSEEFRDWAATVTDYGEGTMTIQAAENAGYDWSTPVEADPEYLKFNADGRYRLPLHALAFHDCHVATWYTGDGVSKVPSVWLKKDLLNILYGTMPLWMPDNELWAKYRTEFVRSYFRVCPVFRATGYDQMLSHEFLTADRRVQRTRFASGVVVTANFGPETYVVSAEESPTEESLTLPEAGYCVKGPALVSYRVQNGKDVVEYVETGDRACLSSRSSYDGGAVQAAGTVVIAHDAQGPFVLALDGEGPILLREKGPLAGRSLERAYLVGTNAAGEKVTVSTEANKGSLAFERVPGIERYALRYRKSVGKATESL